MTKTTTVAQEELREYLPRMGVRVYAAVTGTLHSLLARRCTVRLPKWLALGREQKHDVLRIHFSARAHVLIAPHQRDCPVHYIVDGKDLWFGRELPLWVLLDIYRALRGAQRWARRVDAMLCKVDEERNEALWPLMDEVAQEIAADNLLGFRG